MEWQPIETAPTSGRFLVYGGHWEGEISGMEAHEEISLVETMNGGFYVADTDCYYALINKPTHWMPLPAPPTGDT